MKINIYNNINGFFIITPHFDNDGKIIHTYNKLDCKKKLEQSVNEEIYHIEPSLDNIGYILNTYNNNLVITGEYIAGEYIDGKYITKDNEKFITIYYCYDPDVHNSITSFPGNYKKFQVCTKYITSNFIEDTINRVYSFIKHKMYYETQFSEHEKELKELIINMFFKIGIICSADDANDIISKNNNFEKFNRNN